MDYKYNNLSHPSLAQAVTPSDTIDLTKSGILYVGGTGNIKVTTLGGDTVTFNEVPVGFFPLQVKRVFSTGTTATNILVVN